MAAAGTVQPEQLGWHQEGAPPLLARTASGCSARICCLTHSLFSYFQPKRGIQPSSGFPKH